MREDKKKMREEKKQLESILHPGPKFGDIEICHEHLRGGKISFTAWRGDDPVGNFKQVVVHKQEVLFWPSFYDRYWDDMEWLARHV